MIDGDPKLSLVQILAMSNANSGYYFLNESKGGLSVLYCYHLTLG
jgi:hypothetical protein